MAQDPKHVSAPFGRRFWLVVDRLVWAVAGVAVVVGAAFFGLGMQYNLTPSVPRGLYRSVDGVEFDPLYGQTCLSPMWMGFAVERGYVREAIGRCDGGGRPLIKEIYGRPGQVVQILPSAVYVDGVSIPATRQYATDCHGSPVAGFGGATQPTRLGPGKYVLLSQKKSRRCGWDSRYFGPAKVERLMVPVWVE